MSEHPASRTGRSVGWGLIGVPTFVFMTALLVYPLADFVARSLGAPQGPLHHYAQLLGDERSRGILLTTFQVSLFAAVVTTVVGYPVAMLIASVRPLIAGLLLLMVLLPFQTSVLVRSYAWIVLLGQNGLINTSLGWLGILPEPLDILFTRTAVMVAMVHILLPYTILLIYAAMTRVDRHLLRAAESLGAPPHQVFLRVLLPLTMPAALAGFLLVFIYGLGFFATPALLGGRKDVMVAMLIEEQITRSLAFGQAAATSIVLFVVVLLTFTVGARVLGLGRLLTPELER